MSETRIYDLITETDEVAAARRNADQRAATRRRRAGIRRASGSLTGAYEDGNLERLREDWPQ